VDVKGSHQRTQFALLIAHRVSSACRLTATRLPPAATAAKERVAALKQALAENQAALKHYTDRDHRDQPQGRSEEAAAEDVPLRP
jgi:hypothetical protein